MSCLLHQAQLQSHGAAAVRSRHLKTLVDASSAYSKLGFPKLGRHRTERKETGSVRLGYQAERGPLDQCACNRRRIGTDDAPDERGMKFRLESRKRDDSRRQLAPLRPCQRQREDQRRTNGNAEGRPELQWQRLGLHFDQLRRTGLGRIHLEQPERKLTKKFGRRPLAVSPSRCEEPETEPELDAAPLRVSF